MNKRFSSWSFGAGMVLLVVGSIFVFTLAARTLANRANAGAQPTATPATVFQEGVDLGGTAAPAFDFTDQNGTQVTLDQLRGHPVVLTFFDSVCPHADCSLMAEYINWTAQDLGAQSADVSWVALSVDPWHDTPATATAFLKSRQVTIPMHFLLGTQAQLTPVWQAYHMQAILQPDSVVIHTTGVYVIDAQGRERVYLDEGFDPQILAKYLHQLLTQPSTGGGGSAIATAAPSTGEITQSKTVSNTTVELTATPGQYGTYTFTVTVQGADGTPIQGAAVTAQLTMPAMVMQPVNVALPAMNPPVPGSYQAQGVLSMRGAWHVVVQARLPNNGQTVQAAFDFTAAY
jgi:protein SCO1/2